MKQYNSFVLEEGYRYLYDGKSLEGWKKVGGNGEYKMEEGCVCHEEHQLYRMGALYNCLFGRIIG